MSCINFGVYFLYILDLLMFVRFNIFVVYPYSEFCTVDCSNQTYILWYTHCGLLFYHTTNLIGVDEWSRIGFTNLVARGSKIKESN